MVTRKCVLVVDPSEETREVLRAALEPRVELLAASEPSHGLELARRHHPDVIVLDVDCGQAEAISGFRPSETVPTGRETPLVLLGSLRRAQSDPPESRRIAKPYHYAPLIRTIESLLENVRQTAA